VISVDNPTFAALCALVALVGILLLVLPGAGARGVPDVAALAKLPDGSGVCVAGEVARVSAYGGAVRFSLCTGDCIPAVVFASTANRIASHAVNPFALKSGMRVRATGELRDYRGARELVVSELEVLG